MYLSIEISKFCQECGEVLLSCKNGNKCTFICHTTVRHVNTCVFTLDLSDTGAHVIYMGHILIKIVGIGIAFVVSSMILRTSLYYAGRTF